jgi:hypothetical protein
MLTENSRIRIIKNNHRDGMEIVNFTRVNAATRCSDTLMPYPSVLRDMQNGVQINGKKWRVGTPCFFGDGNQFGIVVRMIRWTDNFANTLILDLQQYRLYGNNMQHWVKKSPDKPVTTIFWNELTHRCKLYPKVVNRINVQGVVRVSTTQPHLDGIDFDQYMHD